jgi:hypothetical protein
MLWGLIYLRGRPYWFNLRNSYYRWRRQRLQRQFQVYMRKHGNPPEPPPEREEPRRGPWVN